MLPANQASRATARAMQVLPDRGQAVSCLQEAERKLAALRAVVHEVEHDQFTGWYDGDHLFGLDKLKQRVQAAIKELSSPA